MMESFTLYILNYWKDFFYVGWRCPKELWLCNSNPNDSHDLNDCVEAELNRTYKVTETGRNEECTLLDSKRRWVVMRCKEGGCAECCFDINPVSSNNKIIESTHSVGINPDYRDKMEICNGGPYKNWIAWTFPFNITMICVKTKDSVLQQNPPIQLSCDIDLSKWNTCPSYVKC